VISPSFLVPKQPYTSLAFTMLLFTRHWSLAALSLYLFLGKRVESLERRIDNGLAITPLMG
jgi:hypothetical protein